jgi:hypothetical protein
MAVVSTGSTQIRIDLETKTKLEELRDNHFRVKTHSDAINSLMEYKIRSDKQISNMHESNASERQRKQLEDLTLGQERKANLLNLQKHLGFRDPNHLIDFLIALYDHSETIPKAAFAMLTK